MPETTKETNIKRISTIEWLRYTFTEEEKQKIADEMAHEIIKARKLEEDKSNTTKQFSNDINIATTKANSAAQKIESGYEMRQIDCEEIYDYELKVVCLVRLDTGETVRERPMTNAELQQQMFDED